MAAGDIAGSLGKPNRLWCAGLGAYGPAVQKLGPQERELADGYLLTAPLYTWYRNNYAPPGVARDSWKLSPLFADDLAHLPPAVVLYADFDPLRDEAAAYVMKLTLAGVPVEPLYFADMIHGFLTMGGAVPAAQAALTRIADALAALDSH